MKFEELRTELIKEVATLDYSYSNLHKKVDTKSYNLLLSKVDMKSASNFMVFQDRIIIGKFEGVGFINFHFLLHRRFHKNLCQNDSLLWSPS